MAFTLHFATERGIQLQEVEGATLRIGRGTGCDLRLADDPTVDLEHALITGDGEAFELLDLGSVTGTYWNGEPVRSARLVAGDRIGIGGYQLKVEPKEAGAGLAISIRRADGVAAEPREGLLREGPSRAAPSRIDHAAAYALARPGLLSKAGLALTAGLLAVGAAAAVAELLSRGATTLPRPGPVSPAHARIGLGLDCAACHSPFIGPASWRCESCHQGPEHQARQVSTPACGSCHGEHRQQARLAAVEDRDCTACHGGLEIAGGGEPRVARRITGFADHPEIRPAADPTPLLLNHALHMKPGLLVEGGRTQLTCESCHAYEPETREILPVTFEQHCARCHDLVFDDRLPERQAPHGGDPERVREVIAGAYTRNRGEMARLSSTQLRSLILGSEVGGLSLDATTRRQILTATDQVFRHRCTKCHLVEGGSPERMRVAAVALPTRWLPGASFSHGPHRVLACEACHTTAAESRSTADVLLPDKAACVDCHGAGATTQTTCVTCHHYHEKSAIGWEATLPAGRTAGRGSGRGGMR